MPEFVRSLLAPLAGHANAAFAAAEREIERGGEGKARPVDIRVLSATNKKLDNLVDLGAKLSPSPKKEKGRRRK